MSKLSLVAWAFIGTAASTAATYSANKAEARSNQRARDTRKRIQDYNAARERRRVVANARRNRSDILTSGQASGAIDGSGVQGGLANQGTQLGAELGHLTTVQGFNNQLSVFAQQGADARSRRNLFQSLGNLQKQGFSLYGR